MSGPAMEQWAPPPDQTVESDLGKPGIDGNAITNVGSGWHGAHAAHVHEIVIRDNVIVDSRNSLDVGSACANIAIEGSASLSTGYVERLLRIEAAAREVVRFQPQLCTDTPFELIGALHKLSKSLEEK